MKISLLHVVSFSAISSTLVDGYTVTIPSTIKKYVRQPNRCSVASKMQMKDSDETNNAINRNLDRRNLLSSSFSFLASAAILPKIQAAQAVDEPGSFDVNDFLKSGMVSQPMGKFNI